MPKGQDYTYENYLRYGAKTRPNVREIHQIDMSQGLVLGFRGRETAVPEGYCTRLQNVHQRNDGTYGIRPPFFVGPSFDEGSFDGETDLAYTIVGTFPDGGILGILPPFSGFENLSVFRTGFQKNSIPSVSTTIRFFGNAAHWGNVSVIPYIFIVGGDPSVSGVGVLTVTYNSNLTLTVSSFNATTQYNHQAYVYQDPDVAGSLYGRSFALTWKGRSFIFAGTGITYSAPLNPGDFVNGGFIPLDTNAPITGVFILQDVLYICTESEIFTMSFDIDPGLDRQIRALTKIQCFGAAEFDNVGYVVTQQGLYRVINNEVAPTFLPSDQNYFNVKVSGESGGSVFPLDTDSVFIPRVCGVHKIGDLILLSGLGFNADRRFGIPDGDMFRYPVFSTTTETWVEWEGPAIFEGGLFSPVNALPLFQGINTFSYGFPTNFVMQMFDNNVTIATSKARQSFINTVSFNQLIQLVSNVTTDPGSLIFEDVPPFIDVLLDILFPSTVDELFAINVEDSSNYTVFIQTARLTFGSPMSWKRLHRYWVDVALSGTGVFSDDSNMALRFFTPYDTATSFEEQFHDRVDNWSIDSDSIRNQTPGHLLSFDNPRQGARFTSIQFELLWKTPFSLEDPLPLNSDPNFEYGS